MSDNILRFIPEDPEVVPDESAQVRGLEALRRLTPDADDISKWQTKKIVFVDQGENFESLKCSICKADLDISWWQQAMDNAWEDDGFGELEVQMPCCHQPSSLNDLDYYFPAGFARFGLEVRNPNIGDEQVKTILSELELLMECNLKYIWAHY